MTRRDLSPGAQAVQSCHALREFAQRHPVLDASWYRRSNALVLVSVPDEARLQRLVERATERSIRYAAFSEPDLQGELTAVALEAGQATRRLCRSLPLTLVSDAPRRTRGP